jgi:hypothetical protein
VRGRVLRTRLLLIALISLTAGCTTLLPISADGPLELKPNEGIVVVQIDSDMFLRQAMISGQEVVQHARATQHFGLWIAQAGRHRWSRVEVDSSGGYHYYYWNLPFEDQFAFVVEPGKINLPGQLQIRRYSSPGGGVLADFYSFSRAAQTIEKLRELYPEISSRYSIVNSRINRDDFVAAYLDAIAAEQQSAEGSE